MTVWDISSWLDWQTKVNTTTHVFLMNERTGVQDLGKADEGKADNDQEDNDSRAMALKERAQKSAQRWKDMYASAPKG